jgi:starch phosphorylase
VATALAVRDTIHERMIATQAVHNLNNVRRIYYFSLEYLMGRLFGNNLLATGLIGHGEGGAEVARPGLREDPRVRESTWASATAASAASRRAFSIRSPRSTTPRSATASTTSSASSGRPLKTATRSSIPTTGCSSAALGDRARPEYTQTVQFYGRVENVFDDSGNYRPRWVGTKTILGVPHDIPTAGYGTGTVNLLRLWASKASEDFDLAAFNRGGYVEAVREKAVGETVSKVLYPNDKTENGKELRLVQQYFFVACSLRDIIRRHFRNPAKTWAELLRQGRRPAQRHAPRHRRRRAHAHPHRRGKHDAGTLPGKLSGHLRLHQPHAPARGAREVERGPVRARAAAPPPAHLRHQHRLMQTVEAKWPGDNDKKRICSLIEENGHKMVRMANLAVVGSHTVNGVAALHTELLKKDLFPEFDALYPGKFQNKTNGITPRRWLLKCNPRLSALITKLGSADWVRDLDQLRGSKSSPTTPPSSANSWPSSAPTRSTSPPSSRPNAASR